MKFLKWSKPGTLRVAAITAAVYKTGAMIPQIARAAGRPGSSVLAIVELLGRCPPNGPRISCGDSHVAHYLTFLRPAASASCLRLLGARSSCWRDHSSVRPVLNSQIRIFD